jgi:hypothetical protein
MRKTVPSVLKTTSLAIRARAVFKTSGTVPRGQFRHNCNCKGEACLTIYNLCTKHNINYINNDDIDKSLLNGSNLHLNKAGDKALGGTFCSYLKSSRPINTRQVPSRNNQRFFSPNWTAYNTVDRIPNVCQSSTEKLVNIDICQMKM